MINCAPILSLAALQSAIIRNPLVVSSETSVRESIMSMASHGSRCQVPPSLKHQQNNLHQQLRSNCLVVVDQGRIVGLFTARDVIRLTLNSRRWDEQTLQELLTAPPIALQESELTNIFRLISLLQCPQISHLPIVDEDKHLIGLITAESLIPILQSVAFWEDWTVQAVMNTEQAPIVTADLQTEIAQPKAMITSEHGSVVIVDAEETRIPQHLLSAQDWLRCQDFSLNREAKPEPTQSASPLVTVQPEDSLLAVAEIIAEQSIQQVVVIGEKGEYLGLITAKELLKTLTPEALYDLAGHFKEQLNQQVSSQTKELEAQLKQQKEVETALKFSESRFRGIFENMSQFIGLLSPDGVLLEANQTALQAVGIERKDAVGLPFWETPWWQKVSPETKAQLRQAIQQAAQGEFIRYEVEVRGINNSWIPIDFSLRPIKDDRGEVILLIPEGRDLTEAKRLEAERQQTLFLLQASQRRYASLVEALPVGIFRCDSLGRCIYTNEVACEILGLSPTATQGYGWQQALHPEDREQVIAQWQQAITENHSFQMEYRFAQPNGTVKWVYGQSAIERDSNDQVHGYIGTVTDISDRKQAEIALETIITGTATTTGQDFFPALVTHLAEALAMSHILVAELVGDNLSTLAFWNNGTLTQNFSYPLVNTPCEQSIRQGEFYCDAAVQEQFPQDEDLRTMNASSYLGVALYNTAGEVIGNLCVFNQSRIRDEKRITNILRVFAARAAAELERQRVNTELEALNEALESKVEERTLTLQQREAELQDFFENAHDLIQSVSLATGQFEYVNQSWRKRLGYSPEEVKNLTIFDVLHPNCHDYCRQLLTKMKNGEVEMVKAIEVTFLSKAGEEILLEGGINCRCQDQKPIATRAIFRDITERKKTEQEIRRLQERLAYLLNSNPAIIYSCQPDGNQEATFISENIQNILGYSSEEFTAQANFTFWSNHIHPDDRDQVLTKASQIWEDDTYHDEYRFLHGEGHYIWVRDECRLIRDEQGNPIEIIGYFADITQQKEIEQAIRDSQQFLKSVLTVFPLYLFWKDTQSVYLGCNQNFAITAGVSSPEAIIGKTDHDLPWTKQETEQYLLDDQEVIQSATPKLGILEKQTQANGQQIWVETSKVPLYGGNGEVIGVLGTYQDITARKEAEERLQQTNEALIRATQLKDEFLANMSHELRTPLNAILGMTEGLQETVYGNINPKQAKALKTIERSGAHLLELINDILDLSKIESGKMELKYGETEILSLCQSALVFIHQQSYKKQIQVETKISHDLPNLFADERRLRQVLINLLTNAVKFTPEGGQVTLDVTVSSQEKDHAYCRFCVSDTGIGIAPENMNRLFEPFIQIDSALNRRYEGTGLGLSLVKRIVELHGGEVGVTSEVGVGSCFYFDLPLSPLLTPPQASTSIENNQSEDSVDTSTAKSPLILLAEDNEANRMTISNYLEAKGYRLLIATNGQQAVELARRESPDIILMDIQMPDTDGLEIMRQLRHCSSLATVPIIALTALAMEGDRDRCIQAGASEYLTKPVRLKALLQTIQEQLGSRH